MTIAEKRKYINIFAWLLVFSFNINAFSGVCDEGLKSIKGALADISTRGMTKTDAKALQRISNGYTAIKFGKAPSLYHVTKEDDKNYKAKFKLDMIVYSADELNQYDKLADQFSRLALQDRYEENFSGRSLMPRLVIVLNGSDKITTKSIGARRLSFYSVENRLSILARTGMDYREFLYDIGVEHNAPNYITNYESETGAQRMATVYLESRFVRLRVFELDSDMRWKLIGDGSSNSVEER